MADSCDLCYFYTPKISVKYTPKSVKFMSSKIEVGPHINPYDPKKQVRTNMTLIFKHFGLRGYVYIYIYVHDHPEVDKMQGTEGMYYGSFKDHVLSTPRLLHIYIYTYIYVFVHTWGPSWVFTPLLAVTLVVGKRSVWRLSACSRRSAGKGVARMGVRPRASKTIPIGSMCSHMIYFVLKVLSIWVFEA